MLRSLVSPERKRAKKQIDLDTDSELQEEEEDIQETTTEELPPSWVKEQHDMMTKLMEKFTQVQTSIGSMKTEVAQANFQAGVAQAIAEEAIEKVEHLETKVMEQLETLENRIPTALSVQAMIDKTLSEMKDDWPKLCVPAPDLTKTHFHRAPAPNEGKFSRTVVIGGFERDTPKDIIVEFMNKNILNNVPNIEEAFAYNFGSIGFVKFQHREAMFKFMKDVSNKEKPTVNGKQIWITTSKTPEERKKAKHLSKFKKVLIETALATASDVNIDYKRGIIFVKQIRVAEWTQSGGTGKVVADASKLKDVNIDVPPERIHDAVEEMLQQ